MFSYAIKEIECSQKNKKLIECIKNNVDLQRKNNFLHAQIEILNLKLKKYESIPSKIYTVRNDNNNSNNNKWIIM